MVPGACTISLYKIAVNTALFSASAVVKDGAYSSGAAPGLG
jgi:hypothetical protein